MYICALYIKNFDIFILQENIFTCLREIFSSFQVYVLEQPTYFLKGWEE